MNSKKLLLVPSPAIWPVKEFEIEILQNAIDNGYETTYVYCKGIYKSCIANKENITDFFNPLKCVRCKNKAKNGLKILSNPSKIKIIENNVDKYNLNYKEKIREFKKELFKKFFSIDKLRKIVDIDGCDIYDSALSTLMTTAKDSEPNLSKHKKIFFDYIVEGLMSYYFFSDLFKTNKYDKVIIFNGRVSRYRPILRLCQKLKIEIDVLEYPEYTFEKYILTPNQYPHDFSYRSKILRKFVDDHHFSLEKKIKIGEKIIRDSLSHVENHGIGIGNFVKNQKKQKLPINWNKNRFNIAFFTSSDFENAGIPEYYNRLHNRTQFSTIKSLRSILPDEIHFVVRIHPNCIDKDLKAVKRIENLQSKNIDIVKANESVDSYHLAIKSDLIITFGSQLSVESAFLGKSVIVFGNSNFEHFNFTINVGKDIFKAAEIIKNYYYGKIELFSDFEEVKKEACLHMFARKYQGETTKYLKKDSYYGGKFFIDGNEKKVSIDKNIHIITKYLGFPILIANEYRKNGFKGVKDLISKINFN